MKKSEKLKMEIAKALAGKVSQQRVADQLGVSQSTISRLANRDDVKAKIEQETIRLLGSVPQGIDNIAGLVNEMPQMTNVKEKELAFKATRKVLEAAGVLNSPSPSLSVVNIVQRNSVFGFKPRGPTCRGGPARGHRGRV